MQMTLLKKFSCRPDFMLLLYPVITMDEEYGHMGSRNNLLGAGNKWELAEKYSNERQVTAQTPPTFLILADDDSGVPPRNSIEFYMALKIIKNSCRNAYFQRWRTWIWHEQKIFLLTNGPAYLLNG